MKKFYSIVLMATALLIGTNMQAATLKLGPNAAYKSLDAAFKAAKNGDVIELQENMTESGTAWFGDSSEVAPFRSVKLDLNGLTYTSSRTGNSAVAISITHGKLEIVNGTIKTNGGAYEGQDLIRVYGTYKAINAKDESQTPFSHLVIGENVTIENSNINPAASKPEGSNAITIDKLMMGSPNFPKASYPFDYITNVCGAKKGLANGVKLEVYGKIIAKKYAIKVNGDVVTAGTFNSVSGKAPANAALVADDNANYSPYIYIGSKASLKTDNVNAKSSIAAYSSGYARWEIHGECKGSTGVYVKSGEVVLQDAIIASNYEGGDYPESFSDRRSGVDAGGSGIVMESSAYYPGDMKVTVSGDTKVTGTSGYAIDEAITSASGQTEVTAITISGGTFVSGDEGAIRITEGTAGSDAKPITITGGTVEVNATTIGNQTLEQFIQDQTTSGATETHISYVDGSMVISEGAPAIEDAYVAAGHDENSSVKWTGVSEKLDADLELKELEINGATAQVLNIGDAENKVTFKVGRLVLGSKAQVIVNPGSKLIVTGEQGFYATSADNFLLKTEEGNPAIFLFHPNVTSNRHPSATVEFISKSWRAADGSSLAWQRFGIPSFGALTEITATAPTAFASFNYENNAWENIGLVGSMDYSQMANSFDYYQMLNNTPEMGTVVTMKGQLYGNESPELSIRGNFWNGFANSYMAPIDGAQLIDMIPNTVDKAFYLNVITENQAIWKSVTLLNIRLGKISIQPMQAFLIRNTMEAADVMVDYADAVYYPTTGETKPAAAPRRALNDITIARLVVSGENNTDEVVVAEGAEFTAEFDNGYDAAKYMNDGINMYVSANEKMSNFATDDLNNTYVGLQTVNGGNYTIEFANVEGAELTLIDHETGARVAMVEGATYEFTANGTNDYRFEIVGRANMPTAIENTEAVKSAKGVYTITGQYVGEMNVWNALPAGVYVVNGEKRVK